MKNKIVLNKANVILNSKKVLTDISFQVTQDDPCCIIGMGSSGKSVLLKSILGLIDLSGGNISINEISIHNKEISAILNTFGVVFQKDALFDSLPVWQNIMFKSLGVKSKKDNLDKAQSLIAKVGLSKNDAFLFPAELSGGMKKRVALARAVSHNPKFLLLDDPTAGLDPVKTNIIFNLIKKLSFELKITLLAISSDMKGVLKYFRKVAVLKDSRLHWYGDTNQIKKRPTEHIEKLLERA
tara:strand:- start:112 stop:831 length:720 start_codon:yes stop_codon:yes gene_type:complete